MNRSSQANRFGTLAERKIVEKYRLELSRSSWYDAKFKNGKPVEIKSTMLKHADGKPGNIKLYERYHRQLRRHDGYYAFAVYKPHGKSIWLMRTKIIHSSQVPRLSWHEGGEHRGTKQSKLATSEIF